MSSLDATLRALTTAATARTSVRLPWRRRRATARGLTVRELTKIAARHPDSRETVWRLFGLSRAETTEPTTGDVKALFDVLATSLRSPGVMTTIRLARLRQDVFDDLLATVVALTVPDDVDALFEPTNDEPKDEDEFAGAWVDAAVVLTKLALKFDPHGTALDWTPGRLLFVASARGEHEATASRGALVNAAVATRLGYHADEQGWKRGLSEITGG